MATLTTTANVGVYIPVFNQHPHLLLRAIESSLAAGVSDVMVIDDGSDPAIESYPDDRVRVIRREVNGGVYAAFNTMLEVYRTAWVVRLGSDDELSRHVVSSALYAADAAKSTAVFWDYVELPEGNVCQYHGPTDRSGLFERLKVDNVVYGGASMLHWSALSLVGPQEPLRYTHDWSYHLRVQHAIGWQHVPTVGTKRGVYAHGLTRTANSRDLNRQRAEVRNQWKTINLH